MAAPALKDVVEQIGFGWGQGKALLLGGSVWAADGAELLIIGSVTRAVNAEWHLRAWQRGSVVSVVFIGVLAGNLISGSVGDTLGRRSPIVASYVGVFFFSVVSVLAYDFYSMSFLRFWVGVAFGVGQPAWNALFGEISPPNRRIHMNALSLSLFTLGELYSALLIYVSDPRMRTLDWRWLILMGAIPSGILAIVSWLWLSESPFFLALHGRPDDAKKVLEDLRDDNRKGRRNDPDRPGQVIEALSVEFLPPEPAPADTRGIADKLRIVLDRERLLFTTIVVSISTVTMNFLFYGGLYVFPQVLPEVELRISPAANLMIGALAELPGYVLAVGVGIYYSRKISMLIYLLACLIGTLVFTYAAAEAIAAPPGQVSETTEIMLMVGIGSNKLFTCYGALVVYLYSAEIYPTVARTTGTAFCISFGRLGAILCPLFYEFLKEWSGGHLAFFYLMACLCGLNALLVLFLPFETKDKGLTDHAHESLHESDPLVQKSA